MVTFIMTGARDATARTQRRAVELDCGRHALCRSPWRGPWQTVYERFSRWRREQALRRTADRRPDLLGALPEGALSAAEREVLAAAPAPDSAPATAPPPDA